MAAPPGGHLLCIGDPRSPPERRAHARVPGRPRGSRSFDRMSFASLGLSAPILLGVAEQGYDQPTPVQTRVIPLALEGRDAIVCARTGTGKTAAFALPLLERLGSAERRGRSRVRALVLTPTRELAAQVADDLARYAKHTPVRSTAAFGGVSLRPPPAALAAGVDVLVATPGRLLDHLGQRTVDLSAVEALVLDEADRMLDMGFLPAIRRIAESLPEERQTLLFSATLAEDVRALARRFLRDPVRVDVGAEEPRHEHIEQVVHRVDKARKRELLARLILGGGWRQVLAFTRTKH